MTQTNKMEFPGDFNFDVALITTFAGAEIDIRELIHSVTIFEDIYSPFLSVEILIEDHIGLYHKLPIRGGEEVITLNLTSTDGVSGFKNSVFSVFKTKDFIEKGERGFMYTLCCISIEAVKDMSLKISKAFDGTATSIAKKLVQKEGLSTDKDFFTEESSGNISYISNYWPPIKNIKYLTQRAIATASKSPSFMFFETKYGFHFMSLASLKSQDPAMTLVYSKRKDNDVAAGSRRIEKLYIDRGVDYIDRVQNGALGSTTVYVDPTKKSWKTKYIDFTTQFDNQARLNETGMSTDNVTRRTNGTFFLNVTPTYTVDSMQDEYSETWFQERRMELASIKAFDIQVEMPGSLEVATGHTVDVYVYSGDIPTSNDLTSNLDSVYSGRYLVTGINHTFSRTRHSMLLSLSKDSLIKS